MCVYLKGTWWKVNLINLSLSNAFLTMHLICIHVVVESTFIKSSLLGIQFVIGTTFVWGVFIRFECV